MAAFASFHPLDSSSSSPPSTTINNMCALFDHPTIALSQFNPHHATNIITTPNNHSSSLLNPTNKYSIDNSSLSVVTNKNNPKNTLHIDKKRKSSSPNSAQSKDMREVKGKKKKVKECKEKKEEAPEGFIHVRARRGQATDSHSLAERVRRERISERMKLLQALVPGCDKVTGKALMLDEIINYVQSLQNQVEFLSMKLASFNPIFYDFGMDMESFMVRPDQNLPPPLPAGMQECSPTTATAYPVLDNSVNSLLLHQSQVPNSLPQGQTPHHFQVDRQALWEVDDQRHKINNLFSFPLMM